MKNVILSSIAIPDLVDMIANEIERRSISPTNSDTTADCTFTITELAAFLKCSKVSIHAYKKAGLPYYRIGRKVLFKKSEILNFMRRKQK